MSNDFSGLLTESTIFFVLSAFQKLKTMRADLLRRFCPSLGTKLPHREGVGVKGIKY